VIFAVAAAVVAPTRLAHLSTVDAIVVAFYFVLVLAIGFVCVDGRIAYCTQFAPWRRSSSEM
jgi:hypothetical protein